MVLCLIFIRKNIILVNFRHLQFLLVFLFTATLVLYSPPVSGFRENQEYQSLPATEQDLRPLQPRGPQSYYLLKYSEPGEPRISGDRQHGRAGEVVNHLRVRVINQRSEPVVGMPVIFEVVSYPAGGGDYRMERKMVTTDRSGVAIINFRLGSTGGEYQIIARIRSSDEENVQLFTLFARESNWLVIMFTGLVGGLALFLLGMEVMSRGLLRSAGNKIRTILGNLTNNRLKALGLGAFVTMLIQSSSATNVMLVSFVNAGLMGFRQTMGIILGAAIGTTITAQLIAFKLTDYSLAFVAVGFAMHAFTSREQIKNAGNVLLGFGILFFGMHIMSEAMFPLRSFDPFIDMLLKLENPLYGILVGTLFTALIQSSSAFVGIMIILGMQGLISLEASIPLLFGANIGTAVTALLASIKAGREAKKVALAVTLFKIFGVMLFIWWIKPFSALVEMLSPERGVGPDDLSYLSAVLPRQIANAHTLYNVFVALLVLPFTGLLANLVERLAPAVKKREDPSFTLHYLDEGMLKTPVMAISLAKQETIKMGEVVHSMVSSLLSGFRDKDPSALRDLDIKEKRVNFLRDQINAYLLKISRAGIREERVNETFQILYTVKELELIADVVSSSMHNKLKSYLSADYSFSNEGKEELTRYHEKTCKQILRAIELFRELDMDKARIMKEKYNEYRSIAFEYEKQHYTRLKQENKDTLMSSKTHLELMSMLRGISSHATNIARILIQWQVPADNKEH